MKRPFRGILALGGCLLFSWLGSAGVEATVYQRMADATGTWSATNRWTPTGAPLVAGDVALIEGGTAHRAITLDADPTLLGIDLDGTWTLSNDSNPRAITLTADSALQPYLHVAAAKSGLVNRTAVLTLDTGVSVTLEGGAFLLGAPNLAGGGNRSGSATMTVKSGAALTIGKQDQRSLWRVAQHHTSSTHQRASSLVVEAGASATFYLSDFHVGGYHGASDQGGKAEGVVDLSGATVNAFDVSGDVRIGRGDNHQAGSFGTVKLPELQGNIGGHLLVGDSATRSEGRLELNGTHLEVGGDVTIDLTGHITVTLSSHESAGLRLSTSSTLTIDALGDLSGEYRIDFTDATLPAEGILYGLAWEGYRVDELTNLMARDAITWINAPNAPAAGLFYDAGADLTYIGIAAIPEPGTVSLLMGGVVLLGWAIRRKDWRT